MAGPVNLVLLRGMLPDLPLQPGSIMAGRVLGPRTLMLEGIRLQASLPEGLQPGQRVRLRVEEATGERVHLRVLGEAAAAPQAQTSVPDSAFALALPGGAMARVYVQEREAREKSRRGAGEATALVVRYDSPTLGRMDVRLDAGAAAVHVADGLPADRVREAAGVLRDALTRATGRPVQVTVHPRQETLDVRA
jgi:hypothetical protein